MQWWEPLKIIPEFYNRGEKLYQEILDKSGNVSGYTKQKSMRPFLEKLQVRFLENPPAREGRLLDVGCGSGLFLKEARELGFDVWGLDFNKKIVEIAKNISESENIYTASLEEFAGFATARNLKFDVITFFEVIEHQDNPNRFGHSKFYNEDVC
jgi:2-polyprenyl-3-methyl-5-hydroxy-6-metoxy-1,4-benzoquinol methylase